MDGSVLVAFVRRRAAGSVVGEAAARVPAWIRRTRRGIVVGLGGEYSEAERLRTTEWLDTVCQGSRAVAAFWSVMTVPTIAWQSSRLSPLRDAFTDLALPQKVRVLGLVLGVATLTHIVALGALQVPVQTLGWVTRAVLAVFSLLIVWRPNLLAAAWRDRSERAAVRRARA